MPFKCGPSPTLLPAWSIATFTIARAGFIFGLCPTSRSKRKLQVPRPDSENSRRGSQRYEERKYATFTQKSYEFILDISIARIIPKVEHHDDDLRDEEIKNRRNLWPFYLS